MSQADDFRAFLGKLDRGRLADALAGAGDDRDVVLQAHDCFSTGYNEAPELREPECGRLYWN